MLAHPKRLIVLLAALVAFGPLSIDMYLPSLPMIADDLGASESGVQMTISLFLAGLCLGMLFYGPLSDRFGRRKLLLGGILLYLVSSLGCLLAQDVQYLVAARFMQALGGAAASVLARAIVRDVFPLRDAARVLSLMHLVTMLATLVAPLLGSLLLQWGGWRSNFVVLLIFAAACLLATWWKIPETLPMESRGRSVGQAFQAYLQIGSQPRALGYILCMGFSFAGMFAFITASPFVYIDHFGVSAQGYAWLFSLNILGIILMTLLNAALVGRWGPARLLQLGALIAALSGALLLFQVLLGGATLAGVVLCMLLFVSVTGLMGANSIASLLALYPDRAGAAAGLAVSTQFAMGTLASALVGVLHDGTPLPMASVVALCGSGCVLALLLIRRG